MTLATSRTNWEHHRRGVPAGEVDGVPDAATTWACLERTDEDDISTTITVYSASGDGGYVTVTVDDNLEDIEAFDDVDAAAARADDLMDEYGASE